MRVYADGFVEANQYEEKQRRYYPNTVFSTEYRLLSSRAGLADRPSPNQIVVQGTTFTFGGGRVNSAFLSLPLQRFSSDPRSRFAMCPWTGSR